MKLMKVVVLVLLLLMKSCLAVENATTKLEQQLNVQKREKQYLIEDDANEGPEQKRDERQSTPAKNNRNLDPIGNSRIINIRMQPPPNILTTPKPTIRPGPQRIPTKIPVILKTAKVVPGPAHAIRMKMLENKVNETKCNANKDNTMSPNITPPMATKDSTPYFTIEDKTARRSEVVSNPDSVDSKNPDIRSNETLKSDGKETSEKNGVSSQNKDNNVSQNEAKKDQVISNSERNATVSKPVNFFVDEPEPMPQSFRRRQNCENEASQGLEVIANKVKEMSMERKSSNKTNKDETRRKINENDDDNDPDVVKMSNGTHLISIKKIRNHDKYKIGRSGEEITVPTEARIINMPPPTNNEKPPDEPEKYSFTDESKKRKQQKEDITGLAINDIKSKEEKGNKNCISKHNHEESEEKTQFLPPITLQPFSPPTALNQGNQECWNYLQNPYYNPYYQHYYNQYMKNYGLAQSTPSIYGQGIIDPRSYGEQLKPFIHNQATIEPYVPEATSTYYSSPVIRPDSTQYSYNAYQDQPGIDDTPCPHRQEVRPEKNLDMVWNTSNDVEIRVRSAQSGADVPDIDIRRDFDENINEAKVRSGIGNVNPYAASTLPININGALVYPYVNQGYRYMC